MFEDEKIAEERYWKRRAQYNGIDTGMYSGNELLEFGESRIFDKVGIFLPVNF